MALATQCPHCHTTFRVAHDQLKLRAGLVRCGACKQIFNGIEHLLRPDQVQSQPSKIPEAPSTTNTQVSKIPSFVEENRNQQTQQAAPAIPSTNTASVDFVPIDEQEKIAEHAPAPAMTKTDHATSAVVEPNDPLTRMTLMNFTRIEDEQEEENDEAERQSLIASQTVAAPIETAAESTDAITEQPDPLDQAIEDLKQKPWRSENTSKQHDPVDDLIAAESDEPAFVIQGRKRQQRSRMLRISLWIVSFALLINLLVQSVYLFRNQLAAWFPQAKPTLTTACKFLECQVNLPSQIDAVSIESSELQALVPQKNTFALTILLRNYSSTAEAWPHIELTLNDTNEKPLVRKVFMPQDYLPARQDLAKGFAANSEQLIKIPFELLQLKASSYRVYLFYP